MKQLQIEDEEVFTFDVKKKGNKYNIDSLNHNPNDVTDADKDITTTHGDYEDDYS